jgi:hypothetical protein
LVGFTPTHGSTSVAGKFVPVWPESAVHDANGLGPETCFGVDAANVDAQATPAAMVPAAASRTTSATGLRALMNHPLGCSAH